MNILQVTNHFHPCTGGIESHVLDLSLQLLRRGHRSDVLCLNRCPDRRGVGMGEYQGIKIYRVPFLDLKYYKVARGFLDYLKGYDIVHVHGLGYFLDTLALTKRHHKKPLIVSTHGGFFHTRDLGPLKALHFRTISRAALKRADAVVAVSRQDIERFRKISPKVVLIPNGIQAGGYRGGKKDRNLFVFVGRLAKNKGIENLVEVFGQVAEKNRKARLFLLGGDTGNLRGGLERKVAERGWENNIFFRGFASEKEKLCFLEQARFFVSASWYEGFGLSLLEAMACGCIPIVNRIGAFQEIIEEGKNGYLIDFSDPAAGEMILNIMQGGEDLGRQAIATAQKYDWSVIMKKWIALYKGVLQ